MSLFSSTQPSLRARVLPRFPARVVAGAGMTITKSGSTYTFATTAGSTRPQLAADLDLYVTTTGSDTAAGTLAAPFLTVQKAIDTALTYDFNGHYITINVAAGTYNENVVFTGGLVNPPYLGLSLIGDETTPSNVIISGGTGDCISVFGQQSTLDVRGFKFVSAAGSALFALDGGTINVEACDWGACPLGYHIISVGGLIEWQNNFSSFISGGAIAHIAVFTGRAGGSAAHTVTLSGTPAFSDAFAVCEGGLIDIENITFAGTGATGMRFRVLSGGEITPTLGSSLTYLPGDVAGYVDDSSSYAFFAGAFSANLGVVSAGTITALDISNTTLPQGGVRQWYYTNNGAHTLPAPTIDGTLRVLVTNGASAGAITFTGFTTKAVPGDALTTTAGNKFLIEIFTINSISTYRVYALQ